MIFEGKTSFDELWNGDWKETMELFVAAIGVLLSLLPEEQLRTLLERRLQLAPCSTTKIVTILSKILNNIQRCNCYAQQKPHE